MSDCKVLGVRGRNKKMEDNEMILNEYWQKFPPVERIYYIALAGVLGVLGIVGCTANILVLTYLSK